MDINEFQSDDILLQGVNGELQGKSKMLSEEIFEIVYEKDDDADASQCADCCHFDCCAHCQHDQFGQDIHKARVNVEEDTDFLEIIPSKSMFLDVDIDPNEGTYLEISENTSNVNGNYKVFEESVETDKVSTTRLVTSPDETEAECRPFSAWKDNDNQNESSQNNSIIQKLEHARKLAESKIREGMAAAADEILKLRDMHTNTKRQLETQRTIFKMLAETEEQKRVQLEQEIERVKDQKLRAEFVSNEANRQCALLGRENARLQTHLKEARLKVAYIDAERKEFRLQLTTLRGTLGLLAREPVAASSPYTHMQTPATASSHGMSGNSQVQQPQIRKLPQRELIDSSPLKQPIVSHSLPATTPAWARVTHKDDCVNEPSPSADDAATLSGDDVASILSGHAAAPSGGDTDSTLFDAQQTFDEDAAKSASDNAPKDLHNGNGVAEVPSVDLNTKGEAADGSDTEDTYATDFSDFESCVFSDADVDPSEQYDYDVDDDEDDYSLEFDDISTTPAPSPHTNQKKTPERRTAQLNSSTPKSTTRVTDTEVKC